MPEQPNGIDAMRERMARASRKPPPSRRPGAVVAPAEPSVAPLTPTPAPPPTKVTRRRNERPESPTKLAADLPPVNLAIRVRKPLDDHLVDLIHSLRGMGVRTSKVELIEMLLWELPTGDDSPQMIIERLRGFRTWAPRGTGTLPD